MMKKINFLGLFGLFLILVGCGSNQVIKSGTPISWLAAQTPVAYMNKGSKQVEQAEMEQAQ